ncbi:DUF3618 domain-containing protein [Nocardia cyriacigeorgica]|uniref:DUF3618 domain-containing protein n=2 Tax=Nocardia cyriacigeorgica TaxID=135487 RepID=A0A5R8NXQ8_9NOCA|nr:DUF3618 domain-containing protein [Nocardia cyriacigeorgica]
MEAMMGDPEPDEAELLRMDRDLTRRELGETVAELSGKFDVRSRAEDKMHDVAEAGRHRVSEAKSAVLHTTDQARGKAKHLAPAPVVDRTERVLETARRRPAYLAAAAAAAFALAWLIVRWRRA